MIISPGAYNSKVGLALFCPITNRVKGYPFEVLIPEGSGVTGAILADQVKSLDWRARNAVFVCELPYFTIAQVLKKLATLVCP